MVLTPLVQKQVDARAEQTTSAMKRQKKHCSRKSSLQENS
jgi:hypothetical protein